MKLASSILAYCLAVSRASPQGAPPTPPTPANTSPAFQRREIGSKYTVDYAIYLENADGTLASWMHDIPLYADPRGQILNMIVEIPRWTNAKFEVQVKEFLNPITQNQKKGEPKFTHNIFPNRGYFFNYGCFPQTWEDPNFKHPATGYGGDKDPLDVMEIGDAIGYTGQIKQVKVLGIIALIDEGETDWKTIVIDVNDEMAPMMNDIDDVMKYKRGFLENTMWWLQMRKTADGKPVNTFGYNGVPQGKDVAMGVIRETNSHWISLLARQIPPAVDNQYEIECFNTSVPWSPYRLSTRDRILQQIPSANPQPTADLPPESLEWTFIEPRP